MLAALIYQPKAILGQLGNSIRPKLAPPWCVLEFVRMLTYLQGHHRPIPHVAVFFKMPVITPTCLLA
jgi:hypothetical protein